MRPIARESCLFANSLLGIVCRPVGPLLVMLLAWEILHVFPVAKCVGVLWGGGGGFMCCDLYTSGMEWFAGVLLNGRAAETEVVRITFHEPSLDNSLLYIHIFVCVNYR